MRKWLAAASLCGVMGAASAQDIAGCGSHAMQPAARDALAAALAGAELPAVDLRIPVVGECEWMAERRKSAREQRAASAPSRKQQAARDHRFHMHQDGQQMSADDFDAWMKSRGIRIAKGAQPAAPQQAARRDRKRGR